MEGSIVHNRKFAYAMESYASIVDVKVDFSAVCSFYIKGAGATRNLKIIDDNGTVHGSLDLDIFGGVPCVSGRSEAMHDLCMRTRNTKYFKN